MKKYGVWAVAACAAMVMGVSGCGDNDKDSDKGGDKVTGGEQSKAPASNGVDKLSATEIYEKSTTELGKAKSLRILGDGKEEGQAMKMDLLLDKSGNCRGSMTMGSAGSFELVKVGEKVWMKPDDAFWKTSMGSEGGEQASKLFSGKWMYGTTSDDMLKDMAGVCDLSAIQAKAAADSADEKGFTKGAPTSIDGQQVIQLKGKNDEGKPLTYSVALTGKPYPVKIEEAGADQSTMTFSDFDKPVGTDTPAEAESIDVAKMEKELGAGA
ncbi:hypothetical protein [Streptomyces sp. NPDC018031]|uniref:hypothetical protein n=1 Tax=Streptomyces sp. NPDC018031 TaxID=3365033 RepID=UPI0037ACE3A0